MKNSITKNEISWWKGMIVVVVAVVIWSIRLEAKVDKAMANGDSLKKLHNEVFKQIQQELVIIKNIQIEIANGLDIKIAY